MSKVLFLDIDGVLNSNFWNDSHQTEISDGTLIDEEKIKLLASLVKETDSSGESPKGIFPSVRSWFLSAPSS